MSAQTDKIKADLAKVKELAKSIGLGGTTAANNNVQTQIKTNIYNITQALADAYPEIKTAYELWKKKDYAGAEAAYLSSNFYKNNNSTARERKTMAAEQPGVYRDSLESYILSTKQRLTKTGVKVDDNTLRSIAKTAFDLGMNDTQVDQLVLKSGKLGGFGGSILSGVNALKSYASEFGITYNKSFWDTQSTKLFSGETTTEDIQQQIRDTAKSAFPAYAEGIDNGLSVIAQVSSKINSMANLLEIDANTITLNDPRLRQAAQYVDPATGKPAQMPDWMWENQVRRMPEWGKTNNARSKVDSLMGNALSDMGLI